MALGTVSAVRLDKRKLLTRLCRVGTDVQFPERYPAMPLYNAHFGGDFCIHSGFDYEDVSSSQSNVGRH